jgi:hypothetical protein
MGGELEAVTIVLENGHPIWVSEPDPQPNLEPDPLARRKLYVTFDLRDRVHYAEPNRLINLSCVFVIFYKVNDLVPF